MPNSTLAAMPAATTLNSSDLFYSVQGNKNVKVTGAQLAGYNKPVLPGFVPSQEFVLNPDDLSGLGWALLNVTCATGQGTAPDGSNNFNKLTDNSVNDRHIAYISGINPGEIGGLYNNGIGTWTFSAYLKQGTARYAQLWMNDFGSGNGFGVMFDLQLGLAGQTQTIGTPTGVSSSINPTSISGVWLASVSIDFTSGSTNNLYAVVAMSNSATPTYSTGNPTYIGTGSTIFVWNCSMTIKVPVGNVQTPPAQPWVLAGYNENTFHCPSFSTANVDTQKTRNSGFQWYLTGSFGFADTNPNTFVFNNDGSLTLNGAVGNQGSAIYSVAAKGTPVTNWKGTAFGGGAYFEATLSFLPSDVNNAGGANGWPAWWSDPVEHSAEQTVFSENWKGQANGYVHYTELDFFEYNVWDKGNRGFMYAGTVIDWSGVFSGGTYPGFLQNTSNRLITLPIHTDFTQPNRFGFLWVPATQYTQGYFQWYFNGLPTSDRVTFNYYDPINTPSPPAALISPWLYGVIDSQHPILILNSSTTGYLRVYSVDVWQASSAGNIVK